MRDRKKHWLIDWLHFNSLPFWLIGFLLSGFHAFRVHLTSEYRINKKGASRERVRSLVNTSFNRKWKQGKITLFGPHMHYIGSSMRRPRTPIAPICHHLDNGVKSILSVSLTRFCSSIKSVLDEESVDLKVLVQMKINQIRKDSL